LKNLFIINIKELYLFINLESAKIKSIIII